MWSESKLGVVAGVVLFLAATAVLVGGVGYAWYLVAAVVELALLIAVDQSLVTYPGSSAPASALLTGGDLVEPYHTWLVAGVVGAGLLVSGLVLLRSVRREHRTLLGDTEPADFEQARNVQAVLDRQARELDVEPPELRISADDRPLSYAVRDDFGVVEDPAREGDVYVVVTVALVNALDDDELRAVLAHHTSHVVNDDLRLMNLVLLPELVADRLLIAARRSLSGRTEGLELAVAVLAGTIGLAVRALGTAGLAALLRRRVYAADRGAAAIGDGEALHSAIRTLSTDTTPPPTDDARVVAALDVVPARTGGYVDLMAIARPSPGDRLRRLNG